MARPKSNPVVLSQEERDIVNCLIKAKETSDRVTKRCRILLNLDASEGRKPLTYLQIAQALQVSQSTVYNVASDYVSGGLDNVLTYKLKPASADSRRVVGGREEAEICRIACSPVPDGRLRWTLNLIAGKIKETLGIEISDETVRRVLKKRGLKPHRIKYYCIGNANNPEFVARMEDILDLYEFPYDCDHPILCMDEKPLSLHDHVRDPIPMNGNHCRIEDSDYVRKGTCSVFRCASRRPASDM